MRGILDNAFATDWEYQGQQHRCLPAPRYDHEWALADRLVNLAVERNCDIGMPQFTELYLFSHFYLSKYMFDQDWIINPRTLSQSIQRYSQSRAWPILSSPPSQWSLVDSLGIGQPSPPSILHPHPLALWWCSGRCPTLGSSLSAVSAPSPMRGKRREDAQQVAVPPFLRAHCWCYCGQKYWRSSRLRRAGSAWQGWLLLLALLMSRSQSYIPRQGYHWA